MRVITNKQMTFGGPLVLPDTPIDLPDQDARALLAKDAVRMPPVPGVIYEVKVVTPEAPQVRPFRNVHNADDEKPAEMDPAGNKPVAKPNVATRVKRAVTRKRGRPRKQPAE